MADATEQDDIGAEALAGHLDLEVLLEAGDLRGVDGWRSRRHHRPQRQRTRIPTRLTSLGYLAVPVARQRVNFCEQKAGPQRLSTTRPCRQD